MRYILLVILMASFVTHAKLVLQNKTIDGKSILYIKDRGLIEKGGGGIEKGDASNIYYALSRRKYDEVWLYSGGGDLYEGVKIGLNLRRFGAFVRVKKGDHCISACTVAFLGGLFRTIDKGASYEVHAYSSVLRGLRSKNDERQLISNTKAYLSEYARKELTGKYSAPFWGANLFEYFRLMIQPIPIAKNYQVFDTYKTNQISSEIANAGSYAFQQYEKNQLTADVKRITKEGIAAAHDITMRIERDSIAVAISTLKTLDNKKNLGHRAKYAIRILETMFESNILSTSELNLQTLKEYGYTNVAKPN